VSFGITNNRHGVVLIDRYLSQWTGPDGLDSVLGFSEFLSVHMDEFSH
jgi:hypothetical protein